MKKRYYKAAAALLASVLTFHSAFPAGMTAWAKLAPAAAELEVPDEDKETPSNADPEENKETPSNADLLIATLSNARAASEITVEEKKVYANGIALVIEEVEGKTAIKNTAGQILLEDLENRDVYGGFIEGTHSASSSITVKSGTLNNIYGGGAEGSILNGNVSIVIEGGTISQVFGGGISDTINGSTSITVNGGTIKTNVYGAGQTNTIKKDTNVTISGGTIKSAVWGGGSKADVEGTANVTINQNAYICNKDLNPDYYIQERLVYGGGSQGSVNKTNLVLNGGTYGWAFAAGNCCHILTEAKVTVKKFALNDPVISGGGINNSVESSGYSIPLSIVNLDGVTKNTTNKISSIYGSGQNDDIDKVLFRITNDGNIPTGADIFANWAGDSDSNWDNWNSSTVKEAEFYITYNDIPDNQITNLPALVGTGVDQKTTITVIGTTKELKAFNLHMEDIDHLIVEKCHLIPYGANVASTTQGTPEDLTLKSLQISADSKVSFAKNKSVTIDEISGSGTMEFYKTSPTITVKKISATADIPLKLTTYGLNWSDTDLTTHAFFTGEGVKNSDVSYIKVLKTGYTGVKSSDGNDFMLTTTNDELTQTQFTKATFDKQTYQYGDQITLEVELKTQTSQPISGEVVIKAGGFGTSIASALLDSDGKATVKLPINTFFWNLDDAKKYLTVEYSGTSQYQNSSARFTLASDSSINKIRVTPADLTIPEIEAPALNTLPQTTLELPEDAFYTAEVLWDPNPAVFLAGVSYTASVKLTPKDGFNLAHINSVSYGGQALTDSTDEGSSIIYPVTTFDPIPEIVPQYRTQISALEAVPEEVSIYYSSLQELKSLMLSRSSFELKKTAEGIVYYDIALTVSMDEGATWSPAAKGVFPENGIDVTLPYPDGTNADNYSFCVTHVLTQSIGNTHTGDMEVLTPQAKEDGLTVHFNSLSPVSVAWIKNADDPVTPPDSNQPDSNPPVNPPDSNQPENPPVNPPDSNQPDPNPPENPSAPDYDSDDDDDSDSDSSGFAASTRKEAPENGQWIRDERGWYIRYADGSYPKGTKNASGNTVYAWVLKNGSYWAFDADGYLALGWIHDAADNHWYYIDENRGMLRGWHLEPQDQNWYYLNPANGIMATGWILIDGKWYYLNPLSVSPSYTYDAVQRRWIYSDLQNLHPYGAMYQNEKTPDNYLVDENGAYIE